jgi:hypothetical protein
MNKIDMYTMYQIKPESYQTCYIDGFQFVTIPCTVPISFSLLEGKDHYNHSQNESANGKEAALRDTDG